MSVFDRSARKPPKKITNRKSRKKNLGRGDFGGSVGAQQTDKILRMAFHTEKAAHFNRLEEPFFH